MGTALSTAGRFAGFIQLAQSSGNQEALVRFGLSQCIGRSANEVLPELFTVLCPEPGGRIDENIAREALHCAIVEFAKAKLPPIEELSVDQWREFFMEFIMQSIEIRLIVDIGQKSITGPTDIKDIRQAARIARQVIRASMGQFFSDVIQNVDSIPSDQLQSATDRAYELAWGAFE